MFTCTLHLTILNRAPFHFAAAHFFFLFTQLPMPLALIHRSTDKPRRSDLTIYVKLLGSLPAWTCVPSETPGQRFKPGITHAIGDGAPYFRYLRNATSVNRLRSQVLARSRRSSTVQLMFVYQTKIMFRSHAFCEWCAMRTVRDCGRSIMDFVWTLYYSGLISSWVDSRVYRWSWVRSNGANGPKTKNKRAIESRRNETSEQMEVCKNGIALSTPL